MTIEITSFDIMTFIVPPSLPAALTATAALAQRRLKAKQISCLSAKHISLCGGVNVICFDKVCSYSCSIEIFNLCNFKLFTNEL